MNHSEIIHIGCDVIDSLKICIDDLSQIKVRGRLKRFTNNLKKIHH